MLTDHEPDELLHPINFDDHTAESVFTYQDPTLLSGIMRAVIENDLDKVRKLVESGKSVNINDNNGNTALHFSVIKERVEILEYLIKRDEILLNSRNFYEQAPIYFAAKLGNCHMVKTLIDAGADVNIPISFHSTPLHVAVKFPEICKLLISNGSKIDVLDEESNTPLNCAVNANMLETVCMLLYYNADVNIQDCYNESPFIRAVLLENVDIQSVLINYVTDFDIFLGNTSLLSLAIRCSSPFIKEIVERGAVFRRVEFLDCLNISELSRFKIVWNLLDNFLGNSDDIVIFLNRSRLNNNFSQCVDVLMENETVITDMCEKTRLSDFIEIFQQDNLSDLFLKFSCNFLMRGYGLMSHDIERVFECFGYCQLFKIMLYINYTQSLNYSNVGSATVGAILNVNTHLKDVNYCIDASFNAKVKNDLENFLELFHHQPLLNAYISYFGKDSHEIFQNFTQVPLLVELARNKTREYIVKRFNVQETSQYYRIINYLPISKVYKEILSYERKLYAFPKISV